MKILRIVLNTVGLVALITAIIAAIARWVYDQHQYEPLFDVLTGISTLFVLIAGWMVGRSAIRKRSRVGSLFNVPQLPDHYIDRPEAIGRLKASLLRSGASRVGITGVGKIGLQGMGGIGKSVLAVALAHDKSIRRKFRDGIVWLTISQTPNIVARQRQLADALGERGLAIDDPQHGKSLLGSLLSDRSCLVILDDVWDLEHAEPFNVLSEKGCLLITTRNSEIIQSLNAELHCLDELEPHQALELLAKWSGRHAKDLHNQAAQVAHECGYLPLALAMVGALVQHNPESWEQALHRLKNADLEKLRLQFPHYPYHHLLAALDASVMALPGTPINLKSCYESLAVFLEDTPISIKTLETFWSSMGLNADDVQDITHAFVSRALARIDKNGDLILHDLQYAYLRTQTKNLLLLHQIFLSAYAKILLTDDTSPWHKLPSNDLYAWNNLTYHMVQAKEWDAAYQLLINFEFLESKCRLTSVYDLEEDFRRVITAWSGRNDELHILKLLEERLRLESHHIAKAPEILFPTLYNYLSWPNIEENPLYRICVGAAKNRKNWLRSTQNPQPEPSLWENSFFEGHTESVNTVAVTPDGERVISGSSDKTVKVWDLSSGRLLHSLKGHTEDVTALAMTPNGKQVISSSKDETVKVWDLSSGRPLRSLGGHNQGVHM